MSIDTRKASVDPNFTPVAPARRSSQIVDQITEAIEQGRLTSGDRLPTERELAETFAVSRVTVRDALRVLEALGLLDVRVGAAGGSFIQAPATEVVGQGLHHLLSMSSVPGRDKAEARLAVEITTLALAMARCTEEDLQDLEALCAQHGERLDAGDPSGTWSAQFHVRLAQASGNRALMLMVDSFRGPLSMSSIRQEPTTLATARRTLDEHVALLAAMRQGDVHRAQDLLAAHLLRNTSDEAGAQGVAATMLGGSQTDD